jgi:hypothetical protein
MSQEVRHFKRVNQNLQLIVEDLTMRHEGLEKESSLLKNTLKAQKELIQKFKDEARTFMQANL